ncbi:efflux RND transporter periplasmic adaptor subunit [Desulfopila inferna]|nr:efflux RND transporter periplasmic adaptor subunit [Desulfopila inferna]
MYGPFFKESGDSLKKESGDRVIPVEVAAITHDSIQLRRTFSGALEPRAEFVVAPKVGGRLERLSVNLADFVGRGQVVAELENDEYIQAVALARADLAVAQANLSEARSEAEIAGRELERVETLRKRGVASETQLDSAKAAHLAKRAKREVAEANVTRAESQVATANIRLGYTRITAGWSGGADRRVVAERFVDEGATVSANTPLLRIVEIDPIIGVIFVTEHDYARMQPGLGVSLVTDAYPGEKFSGTIERIAPVFKEATRQARVELVVDNDQLRLKPGMFIRATVVLEQIAEATLVPEEALAKRDDRSGIFLVSEDGRSVSWKPVDTGIREGDAVQIVGDQLTGRVVTLGQQLLNDGSQITIPDEISVTNGSTEKAIQ